MNATRIREAAAAAAPRVSARLEETGHGGPGNCLWAAIFGVAELARLGVDAHFQAGSAAWRRLPRADSVRDEFALSTEAFSYEYNPSCPVSQRMMLSGCVPEYHAWVAVDTDPLDDDFPYVIDFAAHHVPRICTKNDDSPEAVTVTPLGVLPAGVGLPWTMPDIPNPYVVTVGMNGVRESHPPGIGECCYMPSGEATVFIAMVARERLLSARAEGDARYEDAWAALKMKPPAAGQRREGVYLSPLLILARLRESATRNPALAELLAS